jgi:predicted regulator of Ras-like GTPase activity (Roadblock/LC7/MglB family)
MADATAAAAPDRESAAAALEFLAEMSPDVRGAAILGPEGEVLASTAGEEERWREDAAALFAAADGAEEVPVEQVHIATEQGEVFAIRNAGLAAVAVTDRFALASLQLFDLRSMLRELADAA